MNSMEEKGKAIPTDVYDKDGNLMRIDFHDDKGEFIVQCLWDANDEQTSPKREEFRQWAYRWVKQQGWSSYV